MQELSLGTGFYESRSLPLASQECVNLTVQMPQTVGALSTSTLFRKPGIRDHITTPTGPNRGGFREPFGGFPYVVNGTGLYKINADKSYLKVGTVEGTKRVSFASNGIYIAIIVPGEKGYFCSVDGNTTNEITDPVFLDFMAHDGGVGSVGYKQGYFVYTTDKEHFTGSANTATGNYGVEFDALDHDEAWVNPDKNMRGFTLKNEFYIAGTQTFELFQNIVTAGIPLKRIPGSTIDAGLAARFGIVEIDGSALFIGGHPQDGIGIHRIQAGATSKKSTAAIDKILESYTKTEIETCFAFSWGEYGNRFAAFTLPRHTLVYNATASVMQGRPIWETCETDSSRWRVQDVVRGHNMNFATDNVDGRVGVLTMDEYAEYGVAVPWRFSGEFTQNLGGTVTYSSVELVIETGVGLEAGESDGVDPMIRLFVSDDMGRTFIDMGEREMGKLGVYKKRLIWNNLGDAEISKILRFTGSSPVKTALVKLLVDMEGGN